MSLENWMLEEVKKIDDQVDSILEYALEAHATDFGLETVQIALHNVIENLKEAGCGED